MLDARFNMNTGELTIKCNIIGETGYTKKFKGFIKPGNDENGLDHVDRLVDIIANIMLLCSLCYIRGDYDAIESWTRLSGGMIALTKKGVCIAEFVDKDGKFCYFTYNMSTNAVKSYPEAKARLRLLKNGINDKEPIIC